MAKRNAISPATPRALYEIHTDPATLHEASWSIRKRGVRQRPTVDVIWAFDFEIMVIACIPASH